MPSKDPEVLHRAQRKYQLKNAAKIRVKRQARDQSRVVSPEEREEHLRKERARYHAEKEARKPARAAAYQRNKPTIAAKQQVRLANRTPEQREADAAYHAQYYQDNHEMLYAKQLVYNEGHPDAVKKWTTTRYARHGEEDNIRRKAWKKANPDKLATYDANRRARKRQVPNTWTHEQLAFMLDYWKHACAICGNPQGLFWTLANDHWVPLASPECPGTIATNMIPLCHGNGGCNNSKYYSEPRAWLIRRFGTKKAAKIEKTIYAYFAQVAHVFADVT